MSDRTSASLFGSIFELLADPEPIDRKKLALQFWNQTGDYDFSDYQMGCDDALIALGLAKKGKDRDGYETIIYACGDGTFDE